MTNRKALEVLHAMQKWRRRRKGVCFDPMPYTPKEFGEAIDVALRVLRKEEKGE